MTDPLLQQLLDRAGQRDIAVGLVLLTGHGVITGMTMPAAQFIADAAKRLADQRLETLASVFTADDNDTRCEVHGWLRLREAVIYRSDEPLQRETLRLRVDEVDGWAVRASVYGSLPIQSSGVGKLCA